MSSELTLEDHIANLKEAISLRALVERTHVIGRDKKTLCPLHDDTHPTCHIYDRNDEKAKFEGWHCFACHYKTDGPFDHIDWLKAVHGFSTGLAIRELEAITGITRDGSSGKRRFEGRSVRQKRRVPAPKDAFAPLTQARLGEAWQKLNEYYPTKPVGGHLPKGLQEHGLTPELARYFGLMSKGNDGVLPIRGPAGKIMAFKVRLAEPLGTTRYYYRPDNVGAPAWCSPDISQKTRVIVREGELNAMLTWAALKYVGVDDVGALGMAGSGSYLYPGLLTGKEVFIQTDPDEAGEGALGAWAKAALEQGARRVHALADIPDGQDPCDVAEAEGLEALGLLVATRLAEAAACPPWGVKARLSWALEQGWAAPSAEVIRAIDQNDLFALANLSERLGQEHLDVGGITLGLQRRGYIADQSPLRLTWLDDWRLVDPAALARLEARGVVEKNAHEFTYVSEEQRKKRRAAQLEPVGVQLDLERPEKFNP